MSCERPASACRKLSYRRSGKNDLTNLGCSFQRDPDCLWAQWFSRVEASWVARLLATSLDPSHSRFEKLAGSCTILSRWRAAYQQVGLLLVRDSVGHQNPDTVWTFIGWPTWLVHHRGKTVTRPLPLGRLGLPLSEKQIPQVVENLENGGKPKETLERVAMRPRQVLLFHGMSTGSALRIKPGGI